MPNLYDNEAASYYVDTHKNVCMIEFNGAKQLEILSNMMVAKKGAKA